MRINSKFLRVYRQMFHETSEAYIFKSCKVIQKSEGNEKVLEFELGSLKKTIKYVCVSKVKF